MTLKIDKAGRVILPKPVRDRLGLVEGAEMELTETAEGLSLKRLDALPTMVKKKGCWVFTAKVPAGVDLVKVIDDDREQRIRALAG